MSGFEIVENNTKNIINATDLACAKALMIIGEKARDYATNLAPVGTPESTGVPGYRGGTLRQSITFQSDEESVTVGTNVEYAPYVELGTGPNFVPPPGWEKFDVPPSSGLGHGYVRSRPFLRPAIENHLPEYTEIIKHELGST